MTNSTDPYKRIKELEETVMSLQESQKSLIKSFQEQQKLLQDRIEELERRLWKYENPNVPSSMKIDKEKKHSDDGKEIKKGAPKGHLGATRKQSRPNRFIDLKPDKCDICGKKDIEIMNHQKRIIEDIRIEKVVTQFTQYTYHCYSCKREMTTTHEELPKDGIFGPNILGIWNELHYIDHIPFDRLSQTSEKIFNIDITPGGLHNVIYRSTEVFQPTFDTIQKEISKSNYLRSDETSYPVNGKKYWLWNFSNYDDSLVLIKNSRGTGVIEDALGKYFKGIMNKDCYGAYDKFTSTYQKCWSHILRYAKVAGEIDPYAENRYQTLQKMFKYILYVKENGLESSGDVIDEIGRMKLKILKLRNDKRRNLLTRRLISRLKDYIDDWFRCLIYKYVEPTNNASERDIRKNVIARKISGQHRSEKGIHSREIMMSTILTMQKRGINTFDFINRQIRQYNSFVVSS